MKTLLIAMTLLAGLELAFADGFRLQWALENERHIVVQLSEAQIELVGRERKLILTPEQRKSLPIKAKKLPEVLGVETKQEPDCGCCISSVMWTATGEVTIWLDRLKYDKDGSSYYWEVRQKPGIFTANARGEIFQAGQPVSWGKFVAVSKLKGAHLSFPPSPPEEFRVRIRELEDRGGRISRKL